MFHVIKDTYQIIQEIGSGGGSTVYLAYHIRLQKNVVLKQMKNGVKKILDSRAETDILKNLRHSYLPQVFDFVVDVDEYGNEIIYTVMDFIPGKSLEQLLKEGYRFTAKQVAKYLRQLCEAVAYLHSQNPPIIHGDIKPANIMLTPEDNICLIDFNISGFSDTLEIVGFTKGYAAPEQVFAAKVNQQRKKQASSKRTYTNVNSQDIRFSTDAVNIDVTVIEEPDWIDDVTVLDKSGMTDSITVIEESDRRNLITQAKSNLKEVDNKAYNLIPIDERADIYSIGAAMYPLIMGYKPNPDYEKQIMIADSGIAVSEGLAFVIDKAMRIKPEERFQSAEEMLGAIKTLGKKDRRYKKLLQKQIAILLFFIFMAGASSIVSYIGYGKMKMDEGARHYERSLELYEEKAYNEALSYILKEALKEETHYDKGMLGNLYYLAAECSFETEEYEAAADFYKTSLIYNSNSQETYCNYAISLAKLGKTEQALNVIEQAVERGVESDQIYLMKGELFAAQGNEAEAIEKFLSCIETTQNSYVLARAYIMYSDLYLSKADYFGNEEWISLNIEVLNKARSEVSLEYLPIVLERLTGAYSVLGELTNDQSHYEMAIQIGREMISMGSGTFEAYMNLALLYSDIGQYDESYLTYQEVLEQYGDNYIVYKRLAFLEVDIQAGYDSGKRDYHKFKDYYDKCIELFEATSKQKDEDMEIELLENTYEALCVGGWL